MREPSWDEQEQLSIRVTENIDVGDLKDIARYGFIGVYEKKSLEFWSQWYEMFDSFPDTELENSFKRIGAE